jgi:hypothetical protein
MHKAAQKVLHRLGVGEDVFVGVVVAVQQFQEKESLIAALKIIALGEKDRAQGKGISAADSRAQLLAARQSRK